jgi:hypothetical protein
LYSNHMMELHFKTSKSTQHLIREPKHHEI